MEKQPTSAYTPIMPDTPENPDTPEYKGFEEEPAFELSEDPYVCSPDHDAYIRREVTATLERKQRGKIGYLTLDKAMKKFLPDAC
jgi:hypothetical protein